MTASFKPHVENLEDRLAMSTCTSAGLTSVAIDRATSRAAALTAPAPSIDGASNTILVAEQAPSSAAQPRPVLMVIANQDFFNALSPNGAAVGAASQAVSGRITGIAADPTDGVSSGWGASSYQYAFNGGF